MKIKTRDVPSVSSQSKSASLTLYFGLLLYCCTPLILFLALEQKEGMHFLLRRKERMNCEIKLSFVIIFV